MTKLLLTPHDLSDEETIFHKYRLRDNLDLQKALESTYPAIKFDWVRDLQTLHVELNGGVDNIRSILPGTEPTFLHLPIKFEEMSYEEQKQKVVDCIFRYFMSIDKLNLSGLTIYFRYFQVFAPLPEQAAKLSYMKLKFEGTYNV